MNLVMDEAEEVTVKPEPSRKSLGKREEKKKKIALGRALIANAFLGRIMLRGDNITLIQSVSA